MPSACSGKEAWFGQIIGLEKPKPRKPNFLATDYKVA